jgi:hypothetical protein
VRHLQVPPGDRAQEANRRERADAENGNLQPDGAAGRSGHGGSHGGECDRAEEEQPRREDLADREEKGHDGPGDPSGHYRKEYA